MAKTFAEEIREEYSTKITVEDVINEIKKHVTETYKELEKKGFSSDWVGFDVHTNHGVPKMVWEIDKDGTHQLLVPSLCGPNLQHIYHWFDEQGFTYCVSNTISNVMAFRIEF